MGKSYGERCRIVRREWEGLDQFFDATSLRYECGLPASGPPSCARMFVESSHGDEFLRIVLAQARTRKMSETSSNSNSTAKHLKVERKLSLLAPKLIIRKEGIDL
jgi:hypothetical protein